MKAKEQLIFQNKCLFPSFLFLLSFVKNKDNVPLTFLLVKYRYILMFYIIEMTAATLFGKFFIITRYLFRQHVQNATLFTRPLQQDLKQIDLSYRIIRLQKLPLYEIINDFERTICFVHFLCELRSVLKDKFENSNANQR